MPKCLHYLAVKRQSLFDRVVDVKGTGRSEYEHKVDGYKALFEKIGQPKIFENQGVLISVHVFLYTTDRQFLAEGVPAVLV